MINIKEILNKENQSIEELISCFEEIKRNGDIAVIKFDGERHNSGYTVFVSFSEIKKREMIRTDEDDLKKALITVLSHYVFEAPPFSPAQRE